MIRRLLILIVAVLAPGLVFAEQGASPFLDDPHFVVAQFTSAPTAVTVDVVDLATGTQVGNDLSATQLQRDSVDTAEWVFDLSTMAAYPNDCAQKSYALTFVPDGANCSEAGNPNLCAYSIRHVGGPTCANQPNLNASYVYASSPVAAQGITQAVIDHFGRRGTLPVRYRRHDSASDEDYANPEATRWEIFVYKETLGVTHLACTVPTETDPAVSLPADLTCPQSN